MKRYVTPIAQKFEFNYTDNVTASSGYTTTDVSTKWWTCHTRYVYGDSPAVCGSQGEVSNAYWVCNNN